MKKNLRSVLTIGVAIITIAWTDWVHVAMAQYAPSATYCDSYARNYAQRNTGGGIIGGALGGAASGGLLGGIFGGRRRGAGRGAAIGAIFGGVAGGVRQSRDRERMYRAAFDDCMRGNVGY